MMATIKDIKKAAYLFDASVTYDKTGNYIWLGVEAPQGYTWKEGNVHEMVDEVFAPWKPDFDDMLSRMSYGIEPCDDLECDWCHESEQ